MSRLGMTSEEEKEHANKEAALNLRVDVGPEPASVEDERIPSLTTPTLCRDEGPSATAASDIINTPSIGTSPSLTDFVSSGTSSSLRAASETKLSSQFKSSASSSGLLSETGYIPSCSSDADPDRSPLSRKPSFSQVLTNDGKMCDFLTTEARKYAEMEAYYTSQKELPCAQNTHLEPGAIQALQKNTTLLRMVNKPNRDNEDRVNILGCFKCTVRMSRHGSETETGSDERHHREGDKLNEMSENSAENTPSPEAVAVPLGEAPQRENEPDEGNDAASDETLSDGFGKEDWCENED